MVRSRLLAPAGSTGVSAVGVPPRRRWAVCRQVGLQNRWSARPANGVAQTWQPVAVTEPSRGGRSGTDRLGRGRQPAVDVAVAWTTCRCGNDEDAAIGLNSARCLAVNDKAGAVITGMTILSRVISQTARDTPNHPGHLIHRRTTRVPPVAR